MGHGYWYSPHKGDLVSQRSTELKCLAAEIGQKVKNGAWLLALPQRGDLVSQRSTELKCLAAEIGQKEENGAWLLVLPPQGGLGFPEVHGVEVPGSGDRTEGREWGMATGTPLTRGTWFPRGPRS